MSVMPSQALLELVASRLQAIGEPTRIRIITLLEQREATVQEIANELSVTRQNVSKHVGVLREVGVVTRRKEGSKVFYALADYSTCRLVEQTTASVTGHVEELAGIVGIETAA